MEPDTNAAITNTDHWVQLIKEWESSGLTQRQFCEQRGLNYHTFANWRTKKLKKTKSRIPLKKVNVTTSKDVPHKNNGGFVLHCMTGARLAIPNGCCKPTLKEILKLLGVADVSH